MKERKNYFRKLQIRNKMLIAYPIFIVIPLMCFFLLVNKIVSNYSEKESMFSAKQSMKQTQLYANQKLYNATKLLNSMFLDKNIYGIIADDYTGRETVSQYNVAISLEEYFAELKENNEISHVNIYMPDSFAFAGKGEIKSFRQLKNEKWYANIVENNNRTTYLREEENGHVYMTVGRLVTDKLDHSKYIGAIKIYIEESVYKKIADNSVTTIGGVCYIANADGDIITASSDMTEKYKVSAQDIQNIKGESDWTQMSFSNDRAIVQIYPLEYSDWYLATVIPYKSIRRESRQITLIMAGFMLLIFVITYIVAFVISQTMVVRLTKLNNQMMASRKGSFEMVEFDIPPGSRDEIDTLSESYNDLICRIEQYARAQAEYSKALKSVELKVLQEQINPHFLYNILDLISWMALKKEYGKIVETVRLLAEFYKIGLHRGKETMTVAKEMEHIQLYVSIQKIRYENLLDPEFDIPEELKSCMIQKSLFLPVVENSINHGLRHQAVLGKIVISARAENGDIIFCIRDNGSGISADILEQLNSGTYEGSAGGGFGIRNLNDRIRLYYGMQYGVTFGECDSGAVVYIRVPKIPGGSE